MFNPNPTHPLRSMLAKFDQNVAIIPAVLGVFSPACKHGPVRSKPLLRIKEFEPTWKFVFLEPITSAHQAQSET